MKALLDSCYSNTNSPLGYYSCILHAPNIENNNNIWNCSLSIYIYVTYYSGLIRVCVVEGLLDH